MRLTSAVIFALCLGAGVRLTATASPQTFAVIREGVVHYAFVDGVPATIVCTPGLTCDLALERGEEIQDIVCARSTHNLPQIGWTIDLGSQGNRPYLYLTPTPASPPANLIITTNRRRYVANLIAQPTKHLSYAFDTATSARASDLAPKVAPSSSPLPSPSATPRTVDEKFFTVRPGSSPRGRSYGNRTAGGLLCKAVGTRVGPRDKSRSADRMVLRNGRKPIDRSGSLPAFARLHGRSQR